MINNITSNDGSEKRIGLVYNSDSGYYQGFDFSKIDGIEDLLRNTSSATNNDAFGRLRTSQIYTLNDYSFVYGDYRSVGFIYLASGNNTSVTYDPYKAKATLTVGTGATDFAYNQSRKYHQYRPGKSQLILSSFVLGAPRSGTFKRIGYADDYNGIFLSQSGDGTLHFVLRSYTSGYVYDQFIPQSQWNGDRCDGTGPSKFNLDQTKTQLLFTDFQWLGVGRVRVGFYTDGIGTVAHEFYHANLRDNVYWSNPALPIRAGVRNYAATTGTATMSHICSTVISEGGDPNIGFDFSVRTTGVLSRSIANGASLPMLAIKMKTGFNGFTNRGFASIKQIDAFSLDEGIVWDLWKLPDSGAILGGNWLNVSTDSVVEYNPTCTGINTISGFRMDSSYVAAGGQGAGQFSTASTAGNVSDSRLNFIAQDIQGTNSDVFALVFTNLGTSQSPGTTKAYASMQWRETK